MKDIALAVAQVIVFAVTFKQLLKLELRKSIVVSVLSYILSGIALYVVIYHLIPNGFFKLMSGAPNIALARLTGSFIYFIVIWALLLSIYKVSLNRKQVVRLLLLTLCINLAFEWLNK